MRTSTRLPGAGLREGAASVPMVALAAVVAALGGGSGCAEERGDSVLVHIAVDEEAYRPQHVLATWLVPTGAVVSNARVPKAGTLPAEGRMLGSISISFAKGAPRERRIVVKGMRGAVQVSEAAERLPAGLAGQSEITLVLGPVLADSDGDGLPDKIDDDCPAPGAPGCTPCPAAGCARDGGVTGADAPGASGGDTRAPPAGDAAVSGVDGAAPAPTDASPPPPPPPADASPALPDGPAIVSDGLPPPPVALVAYYRLDETGGMTATDSSGLGNHGTLYGPSPSTLAAPVMFANRGSFRFEEARSQSVRIADSPSVSLTGPFTLAAWVRPTANTVGNQGILEKWEWDGSRARRGYFLRLEGTRKPRAGIFDANGVGLDVPAVAPLPADVWSHVAAVFDGSTLRVYVNGAVQGMAANAPAPGDGPTPLEIGRSAGVGGFDGNIDDVRVYARALATSEIASLAQGNP